MNLADAVKSAGVRYFLAVSSRSVPRFLATKREEVVAINRGADPPERKMVSTRRGARLG